MRHHDGPPAPSSVMFPAEDAEQAVCAFMVMDPDQCIPWVTEWGIGEHSFVNPAWKWCFADIMRIAESERPGERAVLGGGTTAQYAADLSRRGEKDHAAAVAQWFAKFCYYPKQFECWAFQLVDQHARRVGAEIVGEAWDILRDPMASSREASQELFRAAETIDGYGDPQKDTEGPQELHRALTEDILAGSSNRDLGISPGCHLIERHLGGLQKGQLWVIGAATGGGKSVLMLQIGGHAAKIGETLLVFSLELPSVEVSKRIAAGVYGAPYSLLTGETTPENATKGELADARQAIRQMKDAPLNVNDRGECSVDYIRAEIKRVKPRVVVVDYLQLIDVASDRNKTREEILVGISNKLKAIAKDENCTILTASQLNDGKLYAARGIAHAADVVLTVSADHGIIVNKARNREVPQNAIPLKLNGGKQRFEEFSAYETNQ